MVISCAACVNLPSQFLFVQENDMIDKRQRVNRGCACLLDCIRRGKRRGSERFSAGGWVGVGEQSSWRWCRGLVGLQLTRG